LIEERSGFRADGRVLAGVLLTTPENLLLLSRGPLLASFPVRPLVPLGDLLPEIVKGRLRG